MTEEYEHTFKGNCHCGNIHFELHTDKTEADFVPRTCQCGLCRRHGASWVSDPDGKLVVYDNPDINRYQFGHKTSDFIVCSKCGVLTIAICEAEDRLRAVLNIKSMLDYTFPTQETLTNFDDETVEDRIARRIKNWTGEVIISNNPVELVQNT